MSVVYGILKIIHQNHHIDNFHDGLTGNSYSGIELETGRLTKGFSGPVNGDEAHETGPHKDRLSGLEGFQIPGWDQVMRVTLDAARKFIPLRTLGWDIALTNRGPVIIEANTYYATFWGMGVMKKILTKDI